MANVTGLPGRSVSRTDAASDGSGSAAVAQHAEFQGLPGRELRERMMASIRGADTFERLVDVVLGASPLRDPWLDRSTYQPDYQLLERLLSIPVRQGAGQQSGRLARSTDAWTGFCRELVECVLSRTPVTFHKRSRELNLGQEAWEEGGGHSHASSIRDFVVVELDSSGIRRAVGAVIVTRPRS